MTRFAMVFLTASLLAADEVAIVKSSPELTTDRPDFTESTDLMPLGMAQVEGGLLVSRHSKGAFDVSTLSGPNVLLRIGLGRRIELRLGAEGFHAERNLTDLDQGMSDASVGIKLGLLAERRWLPAIAVIGAMSLPVGSEQFSSGTRDPLTKICWSKQLPAGFDAGGNFNLGPGIERDASLTFGHSLSRELRGYAEVYRMTPVEDDEASHTVFNLGVARKLTSHLQVDFEAGHTLGARTPLWFFGFGFAVRN